MQNAMTIAGLTGAGTSATKQRFLLLNRERLRRAQESMRERQQDFLDLLPLLFHVNHPILPGFVSSEGPVGVADYRPSKRALLAAKKIAISFDYKRKALPRYDIYSLFLMGSSGTVAYSQKSDFDIWLCHRPDIDAGKLAELQQKATLIEEWADGLGLEVHFFLINAQQFRAGMHADLSSESSGTAQHYLLLEEFYRTGLLLAGRYPVWWLVPPEQEKNYAECVRALVERRLISPNEFIDFGDVAQLPAEEFFGAALWQLFKGIDSPYKSVLKLLLMEIYASQYPNIDLLCQRFKRAIYAGENQLDQLDPYIMLYRDIEEYLERQGEHDRLDFVRRCFYFKVNEKLSTPDNPRYNTWRRELMRALAQSWGWGGVYLEMLDSRAAWKINRVLRERQILVSELTHSYRTLSNFAREHAGLMLINQKDITVLGRKLYAAFERKAGKVEMINRGISDDLWEARVTFHQLISRDNQESWALFRGSVTVNELAHSTPLKRGRGVCELVAWSYFNGLVNERTGLALYVQRGELNAREMSHTIRCFEKFFPLGAAMEADIGDLSRPAGVVRTAILVNVGVDPLLQHTREGRHLTTTRTDALSYSGLGENLAVSFDQVLDLHRSFQGGRGSGIDLAASLTGGVVEYRLTDDGRTPIAQPLELPEDLRMVFLWTGRSASTAKFLARLDAGMESNGSAIVDALRELGRVSAAGIGDIRAGDAGALLEKVSDFGEAMDQLGRAAGIPILSEEHVKLRRLARDCCVSYKPSGAGGGDVGIGFTDDPGAATVFADRAGDLGFPPLDLEIDSIALQTTLSS